MNVWESYNFVENFKICQEPIAPSLKNIGIIAVVCLALENKQFGTDLVSSVSILHFISY